jgi:hypothetical protein
MVWRRSSRSREFTNPTGGRMTILDGGHDAPLSRRGQNIWGAIVFAVVALGVVAIILLH